MSKRDPALRKARVEAYQAEAKALNVAFGEAHPTTGMIWAGNQWTTPRAFERRKRYSLLSHARTRARENGLPYNLTQEWIDAVWPPNGRCEVLPQIRLAWGSNLGTSPSIDKIKPELGYVQTNCRVISHRANSLKSDATDEELVLLAADAARRLHDPA